MAKKGISLQLEGEEKLQKTFKKFAKLVGDENALEVQLDYAEELRREIRGRAPRGPTGNLKRSIVAKTFRNQIKHKPAAFVAVDYRKGPHAHLVEFGHGGPQPAPPHPFFRPGVDAKRNLLPYMMKALIQGAIKEVAK